MRHLSASLLYLAALVGGCKPAPVRLHFERPTISECSDEPDSSHYCLPVTSASITTFDPNGDARSDLAILARSSRVAVLTSITEPAFANTQFSTGVVPAQANDTLLPCRTIGDAFEDLVHNGHERLLEARIWVAPQAALKKWTEVRMESVPMLGPACADFEGNGTLDLVGLLRPDAVGVRFGDVTGFSVPMEIPVHLPGGDNVPTFVLFADVDGDEMIDVVGADDAASTIFVMRRASDIDSFDTSTVYPVEPGETTALSVAPIDGDAISEIVVARDGTDNTTLSVFAFRTDPEPRLEAINDVDLPIAPTKLQYGDIDDDGAVDVLLARLPTEKIFFYSSDNDELAEIDLTRVAMDYAIVDLNGDARSDLAAIRADPSVLEIFWNHGDGELSNGAPP